MINTHHTKLKGDAAVAATSFNLIRQGFFVFLPTSENCPYDLICDNGDRLWRIQVKYRSDGAIPNKQTWSDSNGTHVKQISQDLFDVFAVVGGENYEKIAYCHISMAGRHIAFEEPNSYTAYYWWEDFKELSSTTPNKRSLKSQGIKAARSKVYKHAMLPREELCELVESIGVSEAAKKFNCSTTAIRNRLKPIVK